jgi:molybdopterin/thiamine biosynthesis adenylyltransferase
MGVRDLSLIDPDTVEASTLDGAGYFLPHLGHPKAEALGNYLRVVGPGARVTPCVSSVTSLAALAAVKRADLLICAADNDGARWASGLLSARYLKVLLDVGVGVFSPLSSPATDGPSMGAEVRLIVPGSEAGPCLACLGGVANPQQVGAMLRSASDEIRSQDGRVWHQERAGSLRFLAELAVGHGLALLFGFLSSRVAGSTWLRVEFDASGLPTIHRIPPQRGADCPVCATSGQGDGP